LIPSIGTSDSPIHVSRGATPSAEQTFDVSASTSALMFAEEGDAWTPLPTWVTWFLRLGYDWPHQQERRRICILSTPCDSPAAALFALGMMRRRLEIPDANDLASHMTALRSRITNNPKGTILRRVNKPGRKNRWRFSHSDPAGELWVLCISDPGEHCRIIERYAFDWHVEGEPPAQASESSPMLLSGVLPALVTPSSTILVENLSRTDSAICLAGRAGGERQTRDALSTVRLRLNEELRSVASLLTINGWHDGRVSRMTYFNSRLGVLDRTGRTPQVVCIDGPRAFRKISSDKHFSASDMIAVVPRTAETDQLENVSQYLASLAQWYSPERPTGWQVESAPDGVSLLILRKD